MKHTPNQNEKLNLREQMKCINKALRRNTFSR